MTGHCYLPHLAVQHALELAGAVRDYDQARTAEIIARADLPALAVTLAAMVDVDRTASELLAWNDQRHLPQRPSSPPTSLMPCGTHAAFVRHRANGTEPCPACWTGERAYQRARKRRRRACAA